MVIHLRKLVVCIALPLIVGWISSLITQGSMEVFETINKPYLSPPGWVFPVVWTILYILMGIASYIVLTSGQSQYKIKMALVVYLIQLAFNFVWPIIFFNAQKYLLAFVWLIVGTYFNNNCFVWKHIKNSRKAYDSVLIMGNFCRIPELFHLYVKLKK